MQKIPHKIKELEGFTNIETKALYNWIIKNISKLDHVEKFLNKAIDKEEFGDLILESFLSNMDLDNFGSVFYDVIVEKALISIYWDEIGERILKNREEIKLATQNNKTADNTVIIKNWLQENPSVNISSENDLTNLVAQEALNPESTLIKQLLKNSLANVCIDKITT